MKAVITFLVFTIQISFAQNTFPSTGNVGIGISNPDSKLVVMNNGYGISFNPEPLASGLAFNRNATSGVIYDPSRTAWQFSARDEMFTLEGYNGAPHQLFSLLKNGNFGIGTFTPIAKLDVRGNILVWGTNSTSTDLHGEINFENSNHGVRRIGNIVDVFTSGGSESGITFTQRSYNPSTNSYSTMNQAMKIISNGNVGIGTATPDSKLAVNGIIHSQEVKVDMNGWSDFVFKKEYNLPTLEEVEKHITEKGHLEIIPSEKEVLEKGINLGEMNAKLLHKIEELTLYIIEQNKKIISQDKKIEEFENEKTIIKNLSERLVEIEKKL